MATAFATALAAPDARGARALIAEAAANGASVARLYVNVVRPILAELERGDHDVRARRAAGRGEAILADLIATLPSNSAGGLGRAAVLWCRDRGIEAVDGRVAMHFLEADEWKVNRIGAETCLDHAVDDAGAGIELVVAATAGPEDAPALARACTDLRRLADPPVIVLCDFSGRSGHHAAALAFGADAVAQDPQELVRCAAGQLPASGQRRWGVRLSRGAGVLSLSPTGCLDAASVGRLADVALSRCRSFSRLVVDLRDLAEIEPAGVRELAAWPDLPRLRDIDLVVVADGKVRGQLESCAVAAPLRVVETADQAVQPASA